MFILFVMKYKTLETQLHKRVGKEGGLTFFLVPGSMLLAAREEDKEDLVLKNSKKGMYAIASVYEVGKLAAYALIANGSYQLAEKLF